MITIDEINQLIEKQGISQTELAKEIGMHQPTLWKNLTKQSKMSLETYNKIIMFLTKETQKSKRYSYDEDNYSSYAADPIDNYKNKNDELVDKINKLEKTIENLLEQNNKLLEIISEIVKKH